MKSNWQQTTTTLLAAFALASCSPPERKDPGVLELSQKTPGCLDGVDSALNAYFKGTVEPKVWKATWDCTLDHLTLIEQNAIGSAPAGFTQKDIHILLSQFIVKNQPLREELVRAHFELKAHLFGGSSEILTRQEIQSFVKVMRTLSQESLRLIPFLKAVNEIPNSTSWNQLSLETLELVENTLPQLQLDSLVPEGQEVLNWHQLFTFISELKQLLTGDSILPPYLPSGTLLLKGMIVGGSIEGIHRKEWTTLLRNLAQNLAGLTPTQTTLQLPPIWKTFIDNLPQAGFDLAWFDLALAQLPSEALTTDKGDSIDPTYLSRLARSLNVRLLKGSPEQASLVTKQGLKQLLSLAEQWKIRSELISRVFSPSTSNGTLKHSSVEPRIHNIHEKILAELTLEDQASLAPQLKTAVESLATLLSVPRPVTQPVGTARGHLSFENSGSTTWTESTARQLALNRFQAEMVMQAYASQQNATLATIDDTRNLIDDLYPYLVATRAVDPTVPALADRRFKDARLFTLSSNGDDFADLQELSDELLIIQSISYQSSKMLSIIEPLCQIPAGQTGHGLDVFLTHWQDIQCFRKEYFERVATAWDFAPRMVTYWNALDDDQRIELSQNIERVARRFGLSDLPIGAYDYDGFSGVIYFMEILFQRFDANQDDLLDTEELLQAFPLYSSEIASFGKIDPKDRELLEAIFTFTVHYGKPPKPESTAGKIKFGGWILKRDSWEIEADRGAILKVFAILAGT